MENTKKGGTSGGWTGYKVNLPNSARTKKHPAARVDIIMKEDLYNHREDKKQNSADNA